jgi:hypothetical protein
VNLKRIQVWVDCEEGQEEDVKRKLESALNSFHLRYTILSGASQLGKTEESQK